MRVLGRIGALPNRILRFDTKLSLMFTLVILGKRKGSEQRVDHDYRFADRMVGFERSVRCDAFLCDRRGSLAL